MINVAEAALAATDIFDLMRERQDAASEKTAKSFIEEQCPSSRAPKGASARVRLLCPLAGVSERPWFDALIFRGATMVRQSSSVADTILANAPPLPMDNAQWQKIVQKLGLSVQQARIVELMLRDLSDRQIALVLGISESTVETHQERIRYRTGTRGRMQLAMLVLSVSHKV